MVIVFPLMANGEYRYRLAVVDFKECYVSGRAERNHQLTQEWIFRAGFAATEWRECEVTYTFFYGPKRTFRDSPIVFVPGQNELIQADVILFG